MTVRIGINGFGRMGRLGLRAGWGREGLSIVRVNEIATDAAGSAHLLQFDSVHGTWDVDCTAEGETMIVCRPAHRLQPQRERSARPTGRTATL